MIVGIYKVVIGNQEYVGQSRQMSIRWHQHQRQLEKGSHGNKLMQAQFDKIGDVSFALLEECSLDNLYEREMHWIDELDTLRNGMNQSWPGNRWNFEWTDEMRAKMSESAKQRGRNGGTFTSNEALEIRKAWMAGERVLQISERLKCHRKVVGNLVNFRSYQEDTAIPAGYTEHLNKVQLERKRGNRIAQRGWKHSAEFIEKFRVAVSGPCLSRRKLDDVQRCEIRQRLSKGETGSSLAREFGVSKQLISKIKRLK